MTVILWQIVINDTLYVFNDVYMALGGKCSEWLIHQTFMCVICIESLGKERL